MRRWFHSLVSLSCAFEPFLCPCFFLWPPTSRAYDVSADGVVDPDLENLVSTLCDLPSELADGVADAADAAAVTEAAGVSLTGQGSGGEGAGGGCCGPDGCTAVGGEVGGDDQGEVGGASCCGPQGCGPGAEDGRGGVDACQAPPKGQSSADDLAALVLAEAVRLRDAAYTPPTSLEDDRARLGAYTAGVSCGWR